jgi:hypothetical protein
LPGSAPQWQMVDKLLLLMPIIIINPENEARKTNYNHITAYPMKRW